MRIKFAPVLLLTGMSLAAGCCSVASKQPPPDSAGSKPRWHSIVVVPSTNAPVVHTYNKLNPIWWVENASEPHPPAWYRPNRCCREVWWWLRNPFSNFSAYVIGVADKKTVRYGRYPDKTSKPAGGWNFAVTRRRIIFLPFVDYKRGRFEFYLGWRKAGNFGVKLNFRQRVLKPPNPEPISCVIVWDPEIDIDPYSCAGCASREHSTDNPGQERISRTSGVPPPQNALTSE